MADAPAKSSKGAGDKAPAGDKPQASEKKGAQSKLQHEADAARGGVHKPGGDGHKSDGGGHKPADGTQKALEAEQRAQEAQRKAREVEAARRREEEARRKEEEARRAREEAERKLKEAAEAARKAEEARQAELARKAEEAQRQLEAARKKEEDARRAREEAERKAKEAGVKKPSDLTPAERAAAKVKEYTDDRRGIKYGYDDQGRVSQITTHDGKQTSLTYKEKSQQPASFEIRDKENKLVASNAGDLKVNQKTGEIVLSSKPADTRGREQAVENHYSPDGSMSVVHLDANGHRLGKEVCQQSSEGTTVVGKVNYSYLDANGQPTEDTAKIDNSKPVLAVSTDSAGRVTDKFQFASADKVNEQKPAAREEIIYREDPATHMSVEEHKVYDLTGGDGSKPVSTTTRAVDRETGKTTVDTVQANGVQQHVVLDREGKPLELTRQEGVDKYTFAIHNGTVDGVQRNGQELTGAPGEQAKQFGNLALETTKQQFGMSSLERAESVSADMLPTGPGKGTTPSGTLVWRDGETYKHARVENGQIKDDAGKTIGTVADTGSVAFAGPPPKGFNITETEGSAFHGVGTDKARRLDIVSNADSKGFNGVFKSPDGKE
ncbi:MAG: hypothetical protein HY711_00445, partial [Candidatus Melainabacteria bacterium]|nr:hypothetical protein [Candidatus Melainabacteria bacterium]